MEMFFVTFGIMLLAVAGMAIGVLFGRLPIAGSCGGLNATDGACQSCSRPCKSRHKSQLKLQQEVLSDSQTLQANKQIIEITSTDMESTDAQFTQS